MLPAIQVDYARHGKVHLYWDVVKDTSYIQYYKVYTASRQDGTYTFSGYYAPNTESFSHRYADVYLDKNKLSIANDKRFFVKITSVDRTGAESLLANSPSRIVDYDGFEFKYPYEIEDTDFQDSSATDIDFYTRNIPSMLASVIIDRSEVEPIEISVFRVVEETEVLITYDSAYTDRVFHYNENQELRAGVIHVVTDGITTGYCNLVVNRKNTPQPCQFLV